jgi:hypothetical protein
VPFCRDCGTRVDEEDRYCRSCGHAQGAVAARRGTTRIVAQGWSTTSITEWIIDGLVGWIVGSVVGGFLFGFIGVAIGVELGVLGVLVGTIAGITFMRKRRTGSWSDRHPWMNKERISSASRKRERDEGSPSPQRASPGDGEETGLS